MPRKKKTAATPRKKQPSKEPKVSSKDMLSTGSTLLNMSLTDDPNGGFAKGKYFLLIGASSSGKTFLSLTSLAEASINPEFKDYRFIYDDAEDGALMDMEKFFGKACAQRVESPGIGEDGQPVFSEQIEDMYYFLDDAIKDGRPFIYVMDSLDAVSSKQEGDKFQKQKTAARSKTKKKVAGDYGDGKAKVNSRNIRRVLAGLRRTGSILIVISQERDNPNAGIFESSKTFSGGRALKFYATAQIWFHTAGAIKKSVRSQERKVGNNCRCHVVKNRYTGKDRVCVVPIYYSHGIDDVGSCVEYLVKEKHWKCTEGVINTGDDFDGQESRLHELVSYIEENSLEAALRKLVKQVWDDIEAKCQVPRKKRYD